MKILLLLPDLPYPGESGAALRNFGTLRGLSEAGHELTLLSFAEKPLVASNPLHKLCQAVQTVPPPKHSKIKRIGKLFSSGQADMEFRLASAAFAAALQTILTTTEFDLIQFSGLELGGYLPQILAGKKRAKVVYDAHNAEAALQAVMARVERRHFSRLPGAAYSTLQSRRLRRFERDICRRVDAVIAVSAEDRALLRAYDGAPIYVMANGINAATYRPPVGNARAACQLVFSGKMDYRPNVDAIEWFCAASLPRLQAAYPQVSLVIVGRNPHRRIQALADKAGIEITGWVESVNPYLYAATVYIVPLRMGSGTRLKILQAMAAGCAIVSTGLGAAGLNEAARATLEIADGGEDFTAAIAALLADGERRQALGAQAQRQVSAHYDWSALIPQLLEAYQELGLA